jgi:rod shape-determining protein MreC
MKSKFTRTLFGITIALLAVGVLLLALAGYLQPAFGVAISPVVSIQEWFSSRFTAIYELLTVPRDVTTLRARNAELENEVSQLQAQVIEQQQQLNEAEVLYALLDFARDRPENQYVAAAVIGRDPSPFLHYLIIDHGSDDGIMHGMPVVTQQGLVGVVDAVTAGAARIQLITDSNCYVNIQFQTIEGQAQLVGSLTGDVTLEMIPQELNLAEGEIVLTSGLGGSYPENILVGQVVSVQSQENDLFQTALVQPAVDFSTLTAVLIIRNFQPIDTSPLIPTTSP